MIQPKVVAICNTVVDHLVHVDKMPLPNGGARILAESFQYGGNAATGIVTVGWQGTSAGIMGVVGDDPEGRAQYVDFQRHNVDTTHLLSVPGLYTGVNMCMSDKETGGRAFLGKARTGMRRFILPEEMNLDYIKGADCLMLDNNNESTRLAAQIMKDKGGEVMFDASSWSETQEAMLPYTTVYITSEFYLKRRYGEDVNIYDCCREMIAKGPHTVIFTLGEKGCVGVGPQGEFSLPAFKIDVVDTTGAGDCFVSGFLTGLLRGRDIIECAEIAQAVSAYCIGAIGATTGIPDYNEIQKFIKNN